MLHRCTLHRSWYKNISHLRSSLPIYMFTLRICRTMNESEKPPAQGVALSFGEVLKLNWTFIGEAMWVSGPNFVPEIVAKVAYNYDHECWHWVWGKGVNLGCFWENETKDSKYHRDLLFEGLNFITALPSRQLTVDWQSTMLKFNKESDFHLPQSQHCLLGEVQKVI